MSKLVGSLKEAIHLCGIEDGMRISFHHALRNGDYVMNLVMDELNEAGRKNLTLCPSAIFPTHAPLLEHIKNGVVAEIETDYASGPVAQAISSGILEKPVIFQSHGGRADRIQQPELRVDVAFIAASRSDSMGNCTGKYGKSAFGSMGYAFSDILGANKIVIITDELAPYPLYDFSISETYVDYVVCVPEIGDPNLISTGTTKMTRDPIAHQIAKNAAKVIGASGLLKDGFNFQTGAGGASLATALYLKELMKARGVHGGCCIGGMTGYLVQLLEEGFFESLLDVQCFDLAAVQSLKTDSRHREITAAHYASAAAKSSAVDSLDVVMLGATQIDCDFNVNVHTDSFGQIMGGSGGHCDAAAGAKLTMIVAPLFRHRIPTVVDHVLCKSTPGDTVDILITQYGISVNPRRAELAQHLQDERITLLDIHDQKLLAQRMLGVPAESFRGAKKVADVLYRDGTLLDEIFSLS